MMRVLVVDDSVVFRTAISAALTGVPGLEVVGTAPNGRIAIQKLEQLSVDLVTLDLEMPDMDGISILKEIRAKGFKVKVIVFSSVTQKGAEKALEALSSGADDVAAKPSGDSALPPHEQIRGVLLPKVLQFRKAPSEELRALDRPTGVLSSEPSRTAPAALDVGSYKRVSIPTFAPEVIVIASSTGGPTALETIFQNLRVAQGVPVLIAQHMPPIFTGILARRLGDISKLTVAEGVDGEVLQPNRVYVAPGDFHMLLEAGPLNRTKVRLTQTPQRNSVRPAADYLFETAASIYKDKCLGVVLTGMGEDGCAGAQAIKECSGGVVIQSRESCVVFGMPGAVFDKKLFDHIDDLDGISKVLARTVRGVRKAA